MLATTFGESAEGKALVEKITNVVDGLKNDQDADVRFFASRALQKARGLAA